MSDKETPTSPKAAAADTKEAKEVASPASPASPAAPASPTAAGAAAAAGSPAAASPTKPGSPSPEAPASAPAAAAAPAAPTAAPTHPNPKVAALAAMFPTVDTGVIEVVLESVGGSQDRAIESLLQMTDPEFKPDTSASQTEETTSQLNMDEEFARALHIQEQEEMRQQPSRTRTTANAIPAVLPYQPRVRRPRPPQPDPYAARDYGIDQRYQEPPAGHGPGGDPPGMIAFEEKLGQFAEAGKQTFNSFLTRAKAKYAELQEQHTDRKQAQAEVANEWRDQGAGEGPMVGAHERKKYGGLWGTSPVSPSAAAPASSPSAAGSTSPRRWSPSDAYETTISPSRSPGPGSGAASPDKIPPGKIDLSKLGFLPKKKVDLMSTAPADRDPNPQLPSKSSKSLVDQIPKTPPAELSPHTLGDSDDDDDLEYTENPFDKK